MGRKGIKGVVPPGTLEHAHPAEGGPKLVELGSEL